MDAKRSILGISLYVSEYSFLRYAQLPTHDFRLYRLVIIGTNRFFHGEQNCLANRKSSKP